MCFWNYQRNHAALFLHCLQLFLASSAHWFLWFLVPLSAAPKPLRLAKFGNIGYLWVRLSTTGISSSSGGFAFFLFRSATFVGGKFLYLHTSNEAFKARIVHSHACIWLKQHASFLYILCRNKVFAFLFAL